MKKVLSVLLSLTIVIGLFAGSFISANAVRREGIYLDNGDLWLKNDGKYTKDSDYFSEIITNDGSIVKEGNTLTLNNVAINGGIQYLDSESGDDFIIALKGKSTIISSDYSGISLDSHSDSVNNSLTIKSASSADKGSLTVTGEMDGIFTELTNFSIKDCTIETTGTLFNGLGIHRGTVTISDSTVTASGCIYASKYDPRMSYNAPLGGEVGSEDTQADGYLTITNSTVTATGSSEYEDHAAISSYGMTINNSTVNAAAPFAGILSKGNIIAEKSKIIAKATGTDSGRYAISAMADSPDLIPSIKLSQDMVIKKGGKIVDFYKDLDGVSTKLGQTFGSDTIIFEDESSHSNIATEVEITCAGILNVQAQKPASISSVTLPSDTDLKNAVLTDADKAAIANGSNIDIKVQINSVQAPSDANKVQQNLGSNTLGMYLDISIIKSIDGAESQVHNLNAPIRITFTIPDNLKGKDKYYVIRVHDGVTTVLNDLDSDPNTVTFETDRFSTYALVYSDTANTGDSSNVIALAVMALSSLGAVAYIERKRVK